MSKRALCATRNCVVREREEAAHTGCHRRRTSKFLVTQTGQCRDRGLEPGARVRERLEALLELERAHTHGADLAGSRRPRPQTGRLEVEDDERRLLEQQVFPGRLRERNEVPRPAQARVVLYGLVEQRARKTDRDGAPELQDEARRVLGCDRPPPLLDELDEPVGGIEAKLHDSSVIRTGVRVYSGTRRPPTSVAVPSRSAAATATAVSGNWPSTQPVRTSSRPP